MVRKTLGLLFVLLATLLTGCVVPPAAPVNGGVPPQEHRAPGVPVVTAPPQRSVVAQPPMSVTFVPQKAPTTVSEEQARKILDSRVMPRSATTTGNTPPPVRSLADTRADKNCIAVNSPAGKTVLKCLRTKGQQPFVGK